DRRDRPNSDEAVDPTPRAKRKTPGSRGSHVWRDHDAPPRVFSTKAKRLRRGLRPVASPEADHTARPKRVDLVEDRKGRPVLIERIGAPKAAPAHPKRKYLKRRSHDWRGPKDRK